MNNSPLVEVEKYLVYDHTEVGKNLPSEVHIRLQVGSLSGLALVLRLRTKKDMTRFIKTLCQHRKTVWPEES